MKFRIIPPTSYHKEDAEAVLSLETGNGKEAIIKCHIDGQKYTVGFFSSDGSFMMMTQLSGEKSKLQSVGFKFDGDEVAVTK